MFKIKSKKFPGQDHWFYRLQAALYEDIWHIDDINTIENIIKTLISHAQSLSEVSQDFIECDVRFKHDARFIVFMTLLVLMLQKVRGMLWKASRKKRQNNKMNSLTLFNCKR